MPQRLSRLFAGALCAIAILTAHADPQPAPLPESLQSMLNSMHIEGYGSLALLDEKGQPMEPDAFAAEVKAGHNFNINKKSTLLGKMDVTIHLISKEEAKKAPSHAPKLKEGEAFPKFSLTRLDGTQIDETSFAGHYTLVSFYFANCAPCIREVPELNALAQQRKDLNMVAVTFDSADESRHFVDESKLVLPVIPAARALIKTVGVTGFPTLMLLDPEGKMVAAKVGGTLDKSAGMDAWVNKFIPPQT